MVREEGEYVSYSESDFAGPETAELLREKVIPALDEVMHGELSTVLGGVDVTAQDIREALEQAAMVKTFLCSYVDGATAMHCVHGIGFYGERSAWKEFETEFCGGGKKLRKRCLKHVTKAARQLLPNGIIPKSREKV